MMIFLLAEIIRRACEGAEQERWDTYQAWLGQHLPWADHGIWWSPYILLSALAFLFLVVPPAWVYWLVEKPENDEVWYRQFQSQGNWLPPALGLIAAIGAALCGILAGSYGSGLFDVSLIVLLCSIVTTVWWTCVVQIHKWKLRRSGLLARPSRLMSFNEQLRFRLSAQLKRYAAGFFRPARLRRDRFTRTDRLRLCNGTPASPEELDCRGGRAACCDRGFRAHDPYCVRWKARRAPLQHTYQRRANLETTAKSRNRNPFR
jgi:hypothetical protein